MPDEIDELLRRAMASLDRQAPAEYFEALADRTLARLDDPAVGELRDHDSGLKDIRDLASETRARLSSRRTLSWLRPWPEDNGVTPSAGVRADAPPEPALPPSTEGGELAGGDAVSLRGDGPGGRAVPVPAPASGRRPRRGRSSATLAMAGVGLAAAAGVAIFLAARGGEGTAPAPARELPLGVASSAPASQASASGSAALASPATSGSGRSEPFAGSAARPGAVVGAAAVARGSESEPDAPGAIAGAATAHIARERSTPGSPELPGTHVEGLDDRVGKGAATGASPGAGAPGRPRAPGKKLLGKAERTSPDELRGKPEAPKTKSARPGRGRTSLTADDIERAMTAVAGAARACFAGTDGLASLRLTVEPSGQVASVTVTGPFAGTPVGACVERAVKAASFPAWDGRPASVAYSYLLSR